MPTSTLLWQQKSSKLLRPLDSTLWRPAKIGLVPRSRHFAKSSPSMRKRNFGTRSSKPRLPALFHPGERPMPPIPSLKRLPAPPSIQAGPEVRLSRRQYLQRQDLPHDTAMAFTLCIFLHYRRDVSGVGGVSMRPRRCRPCQQLAHHALFLRRNALFRSWNYWRATATSSVG